MGFPLEKLRWIATDSLGLSSAEAVIESHVECEPGHTQVPGGECLPCRAGIFNLPGLQGQDQCFPCHAGSHMPGPGAVACVACPESTYQDMGGQATCQRCPDPGMRSEAGSQSADECMCSIGFHVGPSRTCVACPAGTLCDKQNQAVPKPAEAGFWVDAVSGSVLECKPKTSCKFHRTVADVMAGECADGYTGRGCLKCRGGRFRTNHGLCQSCSCFTWVMYTVTALALLLLIPIIVKLSSLQAFGSINILVAALNSRRRQTASLCSWTSSGRPSSSASSDSAIFALKFDVMSPECVAQDWHYLNELLAFDLLPVLTLPAVAL